MPQKLQNISSISENSILLLTTFQKALFNSLQNITIPNKIARNDQCFCQTITQAHVNAVGTFITSKWLEVIDLLVP